MSVRGYFRAGRHTVRAQRRAKARTEKALINEGYAALLTASDYRRAGRLDEAREMSAVVSRVTGQLAGLWARHG